MTDDYLGVHYNSFAREGDWRVEHGHERQHVVHPGDELRSLETAVFPGR